jgi:hypothetical protein
MPPVAIGSHGCRRAAARIPRMATIPSKDRTAESNPRREASQPDLLTIAAIAIAATVIADFIHEGLGHGGACVATGGRPLAISTVHFECSADTRLVAAGGTLANLILGALFWAAARAVKRAAPWRYFVWLLMTFNLFQAGGYFFVLRHRQHRRLGVGGGRVAARVGVACGLGCAGNSYLLLFVCASVRA